MKKVNKRLKTVGLLSAVAAISLTAGVGMISAGAADDVSGAYYLKDSATVTILTGGNSESQSFSLDYRAVVNETFIESISQSGESYVLGVEIGPSGKTPTTIAYVGSAGQDGITATPTFTDSSEYTFTASIIYNSAELVAEYNAQADPDLTKEEILQKVAKCELTAKLYYQVGTGEKQYVDTTVTRSVKNVLNEVEIRGAEATGVELPDTILNEFVGTTNTLTDGDYYLDSATGDLLCFDEGELTNVTKAELGNVDSYVLSGKTVTPAAGDNVTFAVADVPAATGAVRGVSLVNGTTTTNIKATVITKVIREEADLAAIRYDDDYAYYSAVPTDGVRTDNDLTIDGYFLLGNDITFSKGWNAYFDSYNGANSVHAFTGTFDGLGHTLYGMTPGRDGLFGILRGATVKNMAFVDVNFTNSLGQFRSVLAAHIQQNTLVSDVYISLVDKTESDLTGGFTNGFTSQYYSGGLLASNTAKDSTFNNIVMDVPYAYTAAGYYNFGALPVFGLGTNSVTTNTLTNVYLIGEQPYLFTARGNQWKDYTYTNCLLYIEVGSNVLDNTVEKNVVYNVADHLNGSNAILKKYATIANTVAAGEVVTNKNGATTTMETTTFMFKDVLESNGSTPKQYATLQEMATKESDLSTVFGNDNWIVNNNTVVWNTEEFKYFETVAETLKGEFYIEQATGALLKADENGDLKPVTNASIGATNAYLGNANVTLASGDNVAFNATDLANETIGATMQVLFVGNTVQKVQATYITQAIFDLEDLAVLGTAGDNYGYYVLANDIDQGEKNYNVAYTPDSTAVFRGILDGRGHKISYLTVSNGAGMFNNVGYNGSVESSVTIKNIAIVDFRITSGGVSSSRRLFGNHVRSTTFTNVYISYAGGLRTHTYNSAGGIQTGYILANSMVRATFNNVIVENKKSMTADAIGMFNGYYNTYNNTYFISDSPMIFNQASTGVLDVTLGTNHMNQLTEDELYEVVNSSWKTYVTADVLADDSASPTLKLIAQKVANFVASSDKNSAYASFRVSLPGGNPSKGNMDGNTNYQYFNNIDFAKDNNSYTTFSSAYWTMQTVYEADGTTVAGTIPVWA